MRFAYVGVSRHLDRHQIEFWMVALVRMCRELTGLRVTPTRVRLTHRRDDAGSKSEFAEFFGGDLEFGAAIDDVAFAASVGQMPVASADPYLNKILIAYAALEREATRQSLSKHLVKSLTCRERQIVLLVAEGLSNKEICRRLGLSEGTVKIHLHNVYEKVGVNNRTALAAMAVAGREELLLLTGNIHQERSVIR
jgi:DNA-binding CsgD family transcriptional regulator